MSALTNWVAGLSEGYLQCRKLGHAWTDGHSSSFKVAVGFVGLQLTCERCGCQRIDVYGRSSGVLENRRYSYPNQYAKPKAVDSRPNVADYTLEMLKRSKTKPMPNAVRERLASYWTDE